MLKELLTHESRRLRLEYAETDDTIECVVLSYQIRSFERMLEELERAEKNEGL